MPIGRADRTKNLTMGIRGGHSGFISLHRMSSPMTEVRRAPRVQTFVIGTQWFRALRRERIVVLRREVVVADRECCRRRVSLW